MSVHGMLPKWMSDFADGFSKKEAEINIEDNEQEKIAIINLNDLPKVVWQDETFYVAIDADKKVATVYNEFQNIVTTIDGVSTIEEVNNFLNEKEVVKAEEENELEKTSDEESIEESLEEKIEKVSSAMELDEKIAILENKLSELSEIVSEIKAQEYARTDPENIHSMDAQKDEVEHFNETAKQTEEKINKDNSVDLTTMEGRVTLPETQKSIAESYETPSDEVDRMSYNKDENIVKLNSTESDLFKTATCPSCKGNLIKLKSVKNIMGIYCDNCSTEYAINLNNEDIYKKI